MEQKKLSPEEQQAFDIAIKQAMKFITSENAPEVIIKKAEQMGPEKAAVETIVPLMQSIYASARSAGANIPTHILVAVSVHVLKSIAELLVMTGVLKDAQVQGFAKTVAQQAIQMHNSQVGGAA
jgi:hypothetical protein